MMQYTTNMQEAVRLQLEFRSINRILKAETFLDEPQPQPQLSPRESMLYSLLNKGEPKTISEVAEITAMGNTEAYYVLTSLQNKKLVKATPTTPVQFIATKTYLANYSIGNHKAEVPLLRISQ